MHPTWDSWFIIPYISHITYHRGYAISLGLFLGLTISHLLLVPYLYTWLVILHEIPHKEFPAVPYAIVFACYVMSLVKMSHYMPIILYIFIYICIGIYVYYISTFHERCHYISFYPPKMHPLL